MAIKYSLKADGEKQLSKHFKAKEFACSDGTDSFSVEPKLIEILEAVGLALAKKGLGAKACRISEGYRTASYNRRIGGAAASRHLTGNAADCCYIDSEGKPIPAIKACIEAERLGVKGIEMISSTYLHLDTRSQKWFALQGARSKSGARTYKTIDSFVSYAADASEAVTVLKLGSSGGAVKKMQQALGIEADGSFGPKTLEALKAFQEASGLKADGLCGKATWAALDAIGR